MTAITACDFDERYRADPDPWRYRSSAYERTKYAATLEACGPGPFESALELGGSIGVFSAQLASRCRALATIEVLYYMDEQTLVAALDAIEHRLSGAGRLVCVHCRTPGPERPVSADHVHGAVRALPWLRPVANRSTAEYLLDTLERA